MDGQLHYRVGRISPQMPAPVKPRPVTGRFIWMHLVPVKTLVRVVPRDGGEPFNEWFAHGAVRLPREHPPFMFGHAADGGTKIGEVIQLRDSGFWIDGVAQVDDSPAADAFLEDLPADAGRLPVSIGFKPIASVFYPDGVMRSNCELREAAVVEGERIRQGCRDVCAGSAATTTDGEGQRRMSTVPAVRVKPRDVAARRRGGEATFLPPRGRRPACANRRTMAH